MPGSQANGLRAAIEVLRDSGRGIATRLCGCRTRHTNRAVRMGQPAGVWTLLVVRRNLWKNFVDGLSGTRLELSSSLLALAKNAAGNHRLSTSVFVSFPAPDNDPQAPVRRQVDTEPRRRGFVL